MSNKQRFEPHEQGSPVFQKVVMHLEARLDQLRVKNDAPDTAEAKNQLVGRIAEIKDLLNVLNEEVKDYVQ